MVNKELSKVDSNATLQVLLKEIDSFPHHTLARMVVEHVGDMPMLTAKVRSLGVSTEAFIVWMSSDLGKKAISSIRESFNDILDNALTSLLHRLHGHLIDRVEYGDISFDRETGELYRRPVAAVALAGIFDKVFDKREVLRGRGGGQRVLIEGTTVPSERNLDDSESMARAMRVLSERGSGLLIRKKVEETEIISEDSSVWESIDE